MVNWIIDPTFMTDEELLAEYHASTAEASDERRTALAAEINQRGLDI